MVSAPVFVHPHSQLYREGHEWLLFLELQDNGSRLQMRHVMVLSPEWLPTHLPRKVRVSNPLEEPPPIYHEASDSVLCRVSVRFPNFLRLVASAVEIVQFYISAGWIAQEIVEFFCKTFRRRAARRYQ